MGERAEKIRTRAYSLAHSGEHKDHHDVELALLAEGYPDAHDVLNSRVTREELDRICQNAASKPRK